MTLQENEIRPAEVRQILDDLQSIFAEDVIRLTNTAIEDYVENTFIPGVERIINSGLFTEDDENYIRNILVAIALEKKSVKALSGTETKDYYDKSTLLQTHVHKNLGQLRKMFMQIKIEIGEKLITSTTTLAQEIQEHEIPILGLEQYHAGPGDLYRIRQPPEGWKAREMKLSDFMAENLTRSQDQSLARFLFGDISTIDILVCENENKISFIPIPGKTTIEGRRIPTGIENLAPTHLVVFPLNRFQSPYFIERPLQHNFYQFLTSILQLGTLYRIREGVNREGKLYILAEVSQEFENVLLYGRLVGNITVHTKLYGFQGIIEDYVLIMSYPIIKERKDDKLERDLQELFTLIESFHPVKVKDADERLQKIKKDADEKFRGTVNASGKEWFKQQFIFLISRISGMNINDPEVRAKIKAIVEPFESFGEEVKIYDDGWIFDDFEDWSEFWRAFKNAQNGDDEEFFSIIQEFCEGIKEVIDESGIDSNKLPSQGPINPPDGHY